MNNMINIKPSLWGPHLWKYMHYFTFSYPEYPTSDDVNRFKTFFLTIGDFLPCEKCRYNYKNHLKELPLTMNVLSSRDNLVMWLFNLHNIVNKHIGKREFTLKEFNDLYNINNNNNKNNNIKSTIVLFIILIVIIFGIIIYKKNQ